MKEQVPVEVVHDGRWWMLALSTATMMLVLAMPMMALPVLFNEISDDLGLSLVEIGSIWGLGALTGAVFGLFGGVIGDLKGTRWVIGLACIAGGLVGAARGLSNGYAVLAVTTLLMGVTGGFVPSNVHKTMGHWFSAKSYGKTNSVLSLGIGVGGTLGSLVSASVLSPLLGGWREVTFLYGGVAVVIGILWLVGPEAPRPTAREARPRLVVDLRRAFSQVLPIRAFWILTLVGVFHGAAIQGFSGYLPLYLTGSGWTNVGADGALSAFSAASVAGVVPLTVLAERLGWRRTTLIVTTFVTLAGLLALALSAGPLVWPIVVIIGLFREAFMALTITMTVQIMGIGPRYAGTALGLSFSLSGLARFASPPLGNSLARLGPGYPFALWAALAAGALVLVLFVRRPQGGDDDAGAGDIADAPVPSSVY